MEEEAELILPQVGRKSKQLKQPKQQDLNDELDEDNAQLKREVLSGNFAQPEDLFMTEEKPTEDPTLLFLPKPPPPAPKNRRNMAMNFDFEEEKDDVKPAPEKKYMKGKRQTIITEAADEDEQDDMEDIQQFEGAKSDEDMAVNNEEEADMILDNPFGAKKMMFMNTQKIPSTKSTKPKTQKAIPKFKGKGLELSIEEDRTTGKPKAAPKFGNSLMKKSPGLSLGKA